METKHKPTNNGSSLKRSDPLKTVLNYQTTATYMTEINQRMKTTKLPHTKYVINQHIYLKSDSLFL